MKHKKNKFNLEERRMLTEVYRRLNYFHKGNLDSSVLLEVPSRAKCLVKLDIVKPSSKENRNYLNWYKLTDKGKEFFKHYIADISEFTNEKLFNGEIMTFDFNKLLQDSK